jgi:hypothetical protein
MARALRGGAPTMAIGFLPAAFERHSGRLSIVGYGDIAPAENHTPGQFLDGVLDAATVVIFPD